MPSYKSYRQEVQEALQAADEADRCLRDARNSLQKASNWGILDMLGGGFLSTFLKRGNMGDARASMERANAAMQRLRRELDDVEHLSGLQLEMHDFLSFADYFFDGFLADVLVQGRINEAKRQVDDALSEVERIRYQLKRQLPG